jgi:ParB/RepB/Spo0J family partition protein
LNAHIPTLTPFALENAELLRVIANAHHKTKTALGASLTPPRDKSNLSKTLKRLEAEGYVDDTGLQLTSAGETAMAAIARLEGGAPTAALAEPSIEGHAQLILQQIEPDPLNPRKHFDDEAIAELADSIARDGLLENLVVRKGETMGLLTVPIHRLVAGERRWRAMKLLIERGDWPKDQPIMCKVVDIDNAAHRRIALVENLQRKDLRPIDEAQALKELMDLEQIGTAEIAKEIGFTQRFVQQRLQLLELDEKDKTALNAGKLTIEDARRRLASRPKLMDAEPSWWLTLLELYDHAARTAGSGCATVIVGEAITADETFTAIHNAGGYLVYGPSPEWQAGFDTGRVTAQVSSWGGHTQLELRFGDLSDPQRRQAALYGIRAQAGVEYPLAFQPGEYVTPWLNGSFEISAERTAQIEAARAERARQDQARQEAEVSDRQRAGETFNRAQSILAQHRKGDLTAVDPRFSETLSATDVTLPVYLDKEANVVDSNRKQLIRSGYFSDHVPPKVRARNMLLAIALNAAAGLSTPDAPVDEEEAPEDLDDDDLPASVTALATGHAAPIGEDTDDDEDD